MSLDSLSTSNMCLLCTNLFFLQMLHSMHSQVQYNGRRRALLANSSPLCRSQHRQLTVEHFSNLSPRSPHMLPRSGAVNPRSVAVITHEPMREPCKPVLSHSPNTVIKTYLLPLLSGVTFPMTPLLCSRALPSNLLHQVILVCFYLSIRQYKSIHNK